MKKGLLVLAAALITLAPVKSASAADPQFADPGFFDGGPVFYGGWYGQYWGPYWGPSYGYYRYDFDSGEVRLETKCKNAEVYVNGAYAGSTHKNKSMYLRQGKYTIEIRQNGKTAFSQKVFVAAGKTLKLRPPL